MATLSGPPETARSTRDSARPHRDRPARSCRRKSDMKGGVQMPEAGDGNMGKLVTEYGQIRGRFRASARESAKLVDHPFCFGSIGLRSFFGIRTTSVRPPLNQRHHCRLTPKTQI